MYRVKKNELIHLHALLATVAEDFIERGEATPADFEPYAALDISPVALREPRVRHEEAVKTLARLLAGVAERSEQSVPTR